MDSIIDDVAEIGSISRVEATNELERLLADPAFKSPERNRRFLRFVSEEFLAGRGDVLKAYTIAVDAFGRPATFDPSTDSIVRIEAVRLRNALSQYYEAHPLLPVRIDLPKGRYVPMFSRPCPLLAKAKSTGAAEPPSIGDVFGRLKRPAREGDVASDPRPRNVTVTIGVTCGFMVLAIGALLLYQLLGVSPVFTEKPAIAIDMQIAPGDASGEAVKDAIMVSLSQFQTLRTAWRDDPSAQSPAFTEMAIPIAGMSVRADTFTVKLKHLGDEDGQSVIWQVVNGKTGETLRSGVEQVLKGPVLDLPPERMLARSVAARLAGRRGVISELELFAEASSPTLGNGCVVRTIAKIEAPSASDLVDASKCLQATLAVRPNDPDANAAMSLVFSNEGSDHALEYAERALNLTPSSDRAKMAQSIALYRMGKIEAAITAGYRAMAMNPANSAIPSKLSSMVYSAGRWDEGVALAIKSGLIDTCAHRYASMTLALDAYRTGAYDEALFRARQMIDDDPLNDVLLAATLGQQGNIQAVRSTIASLQRRNSGILDTLRADLDARQLPPVLVDALFAGLSKGGTTVP